MLKSFRSSVEIDIIRRQPILFRSTYRQYKDLYSFDCENRAIAWARTKPHQFLADLKFELFVFSGESMTLWGFSQ